MSRTVIPRPYIATIFSSKPSKRRWCFSTICGSNEPARSRGVSMRSDPCSVQRLRCRAVARVADAAGRRATALVAEVTGQLGVHRPLDQPLGQRLQQTALARDLSGRAGAGEQLVDELV